MLKVGEARSLRDLAHFPIAYNVVGLVIITIIYEFSPEHLAEPEALNFLLYLGVMTTHWSLFYIILRRLGVSGARELVVPKKKLRWLPGILIFALINAVFNGYVVLGLAYGRIPTLGNLDTLTIVYYAVLQSMTAGFVEELIWRGYFIEKLLAKGETERRAIIYSAISLLSFTESSCLTN